jgi:hypothetical protein
VEILKAIIVAWVLLLIGDFFSTLVYHVPEHVFGKFHTIVHHGKNRSFLHYAVLTKNPLVLLDGTLGFNAVEKVEFHLNAQQKTIQPGNQEYCVLVN